MSPRASDRDATLRADDVFRLDDTLSAPERGLRDRVRAFGDAHVLPVINGYWERAEFPLELIGPLGELDLAGGIIEGHGSPGLSHRRSGIVAQELARADGSLNTFLGVHSGLAMGATRSSAPRPRSGGGCRRWRGFRRSARSRSPSPSTARTR